MIKRNQTNQAKSGAVVIGGDFQTLGVVRSLAERGVDVFLLESEWGIARYSRRIRDRVSNYELRDPEHGVDFLLQLADRKNLHGWVLFANDDETVKFLAENHERLSASYRVTVPPWPVTQQFYFKNNAYQIAQQVGVPIPTQYHGNGLDDYLAQDLRFPIVLKPSFKENYYPKTHKKAVRANSIDEFKREYEQMISVIDPQHVVVQEMIEGGPKNLYSFVTVYDGNKSIAHMSACRRRQHPMDFGHATTYAESVSVAELQPLADKLLTKMDYRGIAEVEFMWDERDQAFKFIEINGRPWGWNTLAKAAGVNIPYAMYRQMFDESPAEIHAVDGVKWIRLITDMPTVAIEILKGRMKISEYLSSLRGKKEFAVLSLRDPLPFLMESIMLPYLWWKKGF